MQLTVVVGDNLNWLGIALCAGAGYLCGYLFRNINLLKIIALFFIVPFCLDFLIALNNVWDATIPFLLFGGIGFFGLERLWKTVAFLMSEGRYHFGYFMRRRK